MNILILGATGFIGSAVAARLRADGHNVTGLGRNPARARLKQADVQWLKADLATMTRPQDWQEVLLGQDIVVNCAGALQDGFADDLAATQQAAMLALYEAANQRDVKLVVQISATTEGAGGDLPFLATKRRADEALAASTLPYVILRPALVIGRNAHGGSALLRALAGFPVVVPLIHPESLVETVAMDDVTAAVSAAIVGDIKPGTDISLASQHPLKLAELVSLHRQWLGLRPATLAAIPAALAKPFVWLADLAGRLGWRSPLRSTAMAIMSDGVRSQAGTRRSPAHSLMSAAETLAAYPSGVQDLWFARLYLLKPVIIVGLALFWSVSGIIPLLAPDAASRHFTSLPPGTALIVTVMTCIIDLTLGFAVLVRPYAKTALYGMLFVTLAYLSGGTLIEPALWLDPLGPLVKVFPSILLTLVALAILDER